LYQDKEKKEECLSLSVLSFACAKERTKEKHTGNDIQPLPDAVMNFCTTVNSAKQFLSSTSTIFVISLFIGALLLL